jgi:hypothetical protein
MTDKRYPTAECQIGPPPPGEPERRLPGYYEGLGRRIGALVDRKNRAYGDSFHRSGKIMRILYPDGIRPDQMDDALAIIRILDKMFRLATRRDAFGENPWEDIAGYAILKNREDDHEESL